MSSIFDTDRIHQSCFQRCDADPGSHEADLNGFPAYRDDDTRESFVEVAKIFECAAICEDSYMWKRIVFVTPIVALGKIPIT